MGMLPGPARPPMMAGMLYALLGALPQVRRFQERQRVDLPLQSWTQGLANIHSGM